MGCPTIGNVLITTCTKTLRQVVLIINGNGFYPVFLTSGKDFFYVNEGADRMNSLKSASQTNGTYTGKGTDSKTSFNPLTSTGTKNHSPRSGEFMTSVGLSVSGCLRKPGVPISGGKGPAVIV